MPTTSSFRLFAPCPRGLEQALLDELTDIQLKLDLNSDLKIGSTTPGGIYFKGSWKTIFAVNLYSRIASRILLKIAEAPYHSTDDLYEFAQQQAWENWFSHTQTLRLDITAIKSPLKSLEFALLRIKDGVCDRFRTIKGERPSIDTAYPDIRIFSFLNETHCTLYLDTSGEPLFKRGWRLDKGSAPIRENLASGILKLAHWHPGVPLFDPTCGSGTFLAEAAQIALNIPAGVSRRFGFEKFKQYQITEWQTLKVEAQDKKRAAQHNKTPLNIFGSDISGSMLSKAHANLARAGLPLLPLKQQDARSMIPPCQEAGILISNPPYGERISIRGNSNMPASKEAFKRTEHKLDNQFFEEVGNQLKHHFTGWQAFFLSADRQLPKYIRLRESNKTVLFNGALECRLFRFNLFEGTLKK